MGKSTRPGEPEVIDVEFTVVTPARAPTPRKPKKRPAGTEHLSEKAYQEWRKLPYFQRYRITFDWRVFWLTAIIALAGLVRNLTS